MVLLEILLAISIYLIRVFLSLLELIIYGILANLLVRQGLSWLERFCGYLRKPVYRPCRFPTHRFTLIFNPNRVFGK
jgi:hypothetical protein